MVELEVVVVDELAATPALWEAQELSATASATHEAPIRTRFARKGRRLSVGARWAGFDTATVSYSEESEDREEG